MFITSKYVYFITYESIFNQQTRYLGTKSSQPQFLSKFSPLPKTHESVRFFQLWSLINNQDEIKWKNLCYFLKGHSIWIQNNIASLGYTSLKGPATVDFCSYPPFLITFTKNWFRVRNLLKPIFDIKISFLWNI